MGLLGALFGGSKNKSSNESGNKAYGAIAPIATQGYQAGTNGLNMLADQLKGGFQDYMKNAGFDFALGQGLKGITGAGAAQGLLNSGATGRRIAEFGNNLKSQFYGNYLDKLGQLSQLGLGQGGLLASAGQYSKGEGSGKSNGGILSTLFG